MLSTASLEKNLKAVRKAYKVSGICVKAEPGKTPDQIAAYKKFRNEFYLTAYSQELTAEPGWRVVQEPGKDWPSALILFPDQPTGNVWDRLGVVYGKRPRRRNPGHEEE